MNFGKPIALGFEGNGFLKKIYKKKKRVGRGSGSGMGKTSTRGSNGQKSRSGCAMSNFEGGQKSITALPMRGFKSIKRLDQKFHIVHLSEIVERIDEGRINNGESIDKVSLHKAGLIRNLSRKVKVLFDQEISLKLQLILDGYSQAVIENVQKAGGTCS